MYIIDGIAYADEPYEDMQIADIRILDDLTMLVTFDTGQTRLFDASRLIHEQAFAPLAHTPTFASARVQNGYLTWNDGAIDLAAQAVYDMSYAYTPKETAHA